MTRYEKLFLTLCAGVLLACADAPATLNPVEADVAAKPAHHPHAGGVPIQEVNKWLADLRATLAPLHRFELADDAGWDTQATGCMDMPGVGGMGFHYADLSRFDAVVEPLAPELLLYVPERNGRLRLVGVEYAVPFDAWTEAAPPVVHGQEFHRNEAFGLWVLHAWIFRNNPSGIFMDWNPTVNCDYAP